MKRICFTFFALYLIVSSASVAVSSDLSGDVGEKEVELLLSDIESMKRLSGATLSVMGFQHIDANQNCREMNLTLANLVNRHLHGIKRREGYPFTVAPRHNLESIETEYLLNYDGINSDILQYIKQSSLLLTGTWKTDDKNLIVYLKAVAISKDDLVELSASSFTVDKGSLSLELQMCADDLVVLVDGHEYDANTVITVKGFGAANQKFPRAVWKKSAEEAAVIDAQLRLVENVQGALVKSQAEVEAYTVVHSSGSKKVEGWLRSARKVGKTVYPTENTAEVLYQVKIKKELKNVE